MIDGIERPMDETAARPRVAGDEQFSARSAEDPTVAALLRPERAALLVVDVQNDYCHPDGALGKAGFDLSTIDPMVDVVEGLIDDARAAAVPVIILHNEHSERTDSPAWRRKTKHRMAICRAGTWGAELYRLAPGPDDVLIAKHRYSGFLGTSLAQTLTAAGRSTVVVVGTATNVCVESTVRDATMRDYDSVVVEEGVAATDPYAHRASLQNIERFFGHVVSATDVRRAWLPAGDRA